MKGESKKLKESNKIPTRYKEDMTEIELRFYLSLLNEAVFQNGLVFTNHAIRQMKRRNLNKGKVQYVVREGDLYGVQFCEKSKDIKFLLSYATRSQFKKGFTTFASYSLKKGSVISVWNRSFEMENFLNETRGDYHRNFFKNNTLEIAKSYLEQTIESVDFVNFLQKYDKSSLSKRSNEKLKKYIDGVVPLVHL